uniref:Uncharacterized protein n=1 Tax=Setaria italica TaxID=4555 RepID=K3ZBU3_SETIT
MITHDFKEPMDIKPIKTCTRSCHFLNIICPMPVCVVTFQHKLAFTGWQQ